MLVDVSPDILNVKDSLLKGTAYDIRAYVGELDNFFTDEAILTPSSIEVIGVLMGSLHFKAKSGADVYLEEGDSVVVGHDNGPTSRLLAISFANGLVSQGVDVYDIGIASSGQVYHNQSQLGAKGYVQITRSHVEVTTNGAKFGIGSQGIHTYLLQQMNDALSCPEGKRCIIGRKSSVVGKIYDKADVARSMYIDKMVGRYAEYFKANPRKVAVNLFGGTGLQYVDLFIRVLGRDNVLILGDKLNVNSGGLLADPTRGEMLEKVPDFEKTLEAGVRIHSFDLDADRGSISEGADALSGGSGHYLGDDLAYVIAKYKRDIILPSLIVKINELNLPKKSLDRIHEIASTIYVDLKYTSGVNAFVVSMGGETTYHRKGHSLWKESMVQNMEEIARLAGFESTSELAQELEYQDIQIEASLHMFVTDPLDGIPRDDAIENVFILEKMFDRLNITVLKEFFGKIEHRYVTKEIRTNCISNEAKEDITKSVMTTIKRKFATANILKGSTGSKERYRLIEFDGQIRAEWRSGFIMYGMSNTSSKLTFIAEGATIEERNEALAYVLHLHNAAKSVHGDNLPMDLDENQLFTCDDSYGIKEPDKMNADDNRVKKFIIDRQL